MANEQRDGIAIATLMTNLSAEAGRLAKVAQRLDDMLGGLAASDVQLAQSLLVEFQDVDTLRQALEALSQITGSAAVEIPIQANVQLPKSALAFGATLEVVREACLRTIDGLNALPPPVSCASESRGEGEPIFFDDI